MTAEFRSNQAEIKNQLNEMESKLEVLTTRINEVEERVSDIEDKLTGKRETARQEGGSSHLLETQILSLCSSILSGTH